MKSILQNTHSQGARVTAHRSFSIALNCSGSRGTVDTCDFLFPIYTVVFHIKLACLKSLVLAAETWETPGSCHWLAWAENCWNVPLSVSYKQSSQIAEEICGLSSAKVVGKNFKKANKPSACFGKCKWETCFIAASEWQPLAEERKESQRWETTFQSFHPSHVALRHWGLFTSTATATSPAEFFRCQLPHQFFGRDQNSPAQMSPIALMFVFSPST